MNRILFLSSKTNQQENSFFAQAKTQLSSCENQYLKFNFQSSDFCDADVLEKAKTANAILFFATNKQDELIADSIRKSLGLYAQIATLSRNIDNVNHLYCIVQDKNGGIYEGEKGFANNSSFGREAMTSKDTANLKSNAPHALPTTSQTTPAALLHLPTKPTNSPLRNSGEKSSPTSTRIILLYPSICKTSPTF